MSELSIIPFHRPSIGPAEKEAVERVLDSRWLTTGDVTLQFEREFAAYVNCKRALAVNSGTAALHLALAAVGLSRDDEVLVPTYTFTATAEVVAYFGARPVLCDTLAGEFNLDCRDAEQRVTEHTRAIIPVHVAGQVCDLEAVHSLARRHKLHVIEDAAHALPASWRGQRIGSTSALTAFSFYATKTITTGEGGMLTIDDEQLAGRAAMLRLHGIGSEVWKRYSNAGSWYYEVQLAGYKMNMPDLLAAIGRVQLQKCDALQWRRQEIATAYNEAFADVPELETPPVGDLKGQHAWHLYILRLRPERLNIGRAEFIQELKAQGIGASVHFIPLHLHPFYAREYGYRPHDFSNAEDAYSRCLSLPIFPDLTVAEVDRIISAVRAIVCENRTRAVAAVS